MKVFLATGNKHKIDEIKAIFANVKDVEILSIKDGIEIPEVVEDGDTFEANSAKKALEIAKFTGMITIADDSGLCVDALGGAPGVYSARYSGENATIKKDGDRLLFDVSNEYAEPADKYRDNENVLFSRPNFYGEIADNIGICDVERLRQNVRGIDNKEEYNTLKDLIKDDNRQFPVVVFVASDDYWVEKFDVDYFAYLVGYYAHIKRITTDELSEQFAKDYDLDEDEFRDSITVFYPGREPNTSYKSHILNTTFEVIKIEKRKYWNENGCRAFRRQLVSDIRENNVIM